MSTFPKMFNSLASFPCQLTNNLSLCLEWTRGNIFALGYTHRFVSVKSHKKWFREKKMSEGKKLHSCQIADSFISAVPEWNNSWSANRTDTESLFTVLLPKSYIRSKLRFILQTLSSPLHCHLDHWRTRIWSAKLLASVDGEKLPMASIKNIEYKYIFWYRYKCYSIQLS